MQPLSKSPTPPVAEPSAKKKKPRKKKKKNKDEEDEKDAEENLSPPDSPRFEQELLKFKSSLDLTFASAVNARLIPNIS